MLLFRGYGAVGRQSAEAARAASAAQLFSGEALFAALSSGKICRVIVGVAAAAKLRTAVEFVVMSAVKFRSSPPSTSRRLGKLVG
jgi:hypothetical protein